jgi:PTH1 family peptidyl-tRNA hydrolase
MPKKVIIGLGNPELSIYKQLPTVDPAKVEELVALEAQGLYINPDATRHNAGFLAVAKAAGATAFNYDRQLYAEIASVTLSGTSLVLVRPMTSMNASGIAAKAVLAALGLTPADMLLAYDDKDLPLGKLRFQRGEQEFGSGGGHNGVKSVMTELGSNEFDRLKIGVGPLPKGAMIIKFVLSPFPAESTEHYARVIAAAAEASIFWANGGFTDAKVTTNIA